MQGTMKVMSRNGWRRLLTFAAVVWLCLVLAAPAMAAKKKKTEPEGPQEKSYVTPYFVVVMSIGLGVLLVCRPGRRLDGPRRPKDEGSK